MAKKILLLLSFVFCLQFVVAQTMSDEQIIQFVISEQEKGTSQNAIATKLVQRGVSPNRLLELKNKFESNGSLLGDASAIKNVSRSRVNDEKNKENQSQETAKTADNQKKADKVEAAKPASPGKPKVFGRNIFNNKLLTFAPYLDVPTPADYVLGAKDFVFIDVWGASQNMIEAEISPDGTIVIEGVGPLHLAGKTVKAANEYLKEVLGNVYAGSDINLSVGKTRSIIVQVVGEVVAPGTYTMSALSTAYNALYAAGGITDIGTLRAINVFRNGKKVATIDVYDYIFNGKIDSNVRLQDNDVISVGAYDAIVNIQGKTKRPMMYEMKANETLSKLVQFSGGFAGDAYSEKVRVVRKSGREYSLFTVDRKNMNAFTMCDGDSVYVDSIISRFSNMIEIKGAVFFPGQYQYGEDINTVSELIAAAGGVREDAFLNRAVLHHRNLDNTIEAKAVDVNGIINGTSDDVALRNNDILFIPSESDMRGNQTVTVGGEVNMPGVYKFAENTTIEDVILQAGGLTRAASMAKVDIFRQRHDPYALEEAETTTETYCFEIKDGFVVDGEKGFVLMPFDEVYVRRSPYHREIQNVEIKGAVNFEGEYALSSKNYRISDLVNAAGGLSNQAYAKGAYLFREITEEELVQRELLQTLSHVELYEEILRSDRSTNMAVLDSLYNAKINAGNMYPVAIDLEKAVKEPGSHYDIILRAGDVITVPEYTSTIKIRGEVKYPTTVNWQKGKSLRYYIDHAGGFGNMAKKRGVYVINMNGTVNKISRCSKKAIQPGSEIVIPRKPARKMSTSEIMAIGTSAISLSTMIVTLVNLIDK